MFSVEFDQVENKKTVDEIEFSPIFFFFRSLKDQITGFLFSFKKRVVLHHIQL